MDGYRIEICTEIERGKKIILNTLLPELPIKFEVPRGEILITEENSTEQTMKLLEALLFENAISTVDFRVIGDIKSWKENQKKVEEVSTGGPVEEPEAEEAAQEPEEEPEPEAQPEAAKEPAKEPEAEAQPEVAEKSAKEPEAEAQPEVAEKSAKEPEAEAQPEAAEEPAKEPEAETQPEAADKFLIKDRIKRLFEETGKTWGIKEISEELEIPYGSASSNVSRLYYERVLVRVDKKYALSVKKPEAEATSKETAEEPISIKDRIRSFFEETEQAWRIKEVSEKLGISYASASNIIYQLYYEHVLVKNNKKYALSVKEPEAQPEEVAEKPAEGPETEAQPEEVAENPAEEPEAEAQPEEVAENPAEEPEAEVQSEEVAENPAEEPEAEAQPEEVAENPAEELEEVLPKGLTVKEQNLWKIKNLLKQEKYKEILGYIFYSRSSFNVVLMRKQFSTSRELVEDVLETLINEAIFRDEKHMERYVVSTKWRIYAYLQRKKGTQGTADGTIRYDLGISDSELRQTLKEALKDGLVEKVKSEKRTERYKVIL